MKNTTKNEGYAVKTNKNEEKTPMQLNEEAEWSGLRLAGEPDVPAEIVELNIYKEKGVSYNDAVVPRLGASLWTPDNRRIGFTLWHPDWSKKLQIVFEKEWGEEWLYDHIHKIYVSRVVRVVYVIREVADWEVWFFRVDKDGNIAMMMDSGFKTWEIAEAVARGGETFLNFAQMTGW